MNDLFTLYRYLVQNSHSAEEDNPYALALATLEPVLDLLSELEFSGEFVREQGGFEFDRAHDIVKKIIESHKTALCQYADGSLEAVTDFAQTHIRLKDIDKLIDALQNQKKTLLEYKKFEEEELGDLDDHPF